MRPNDVVSSPGAVPSRGWTGWGIFRTRGPLLRTRHCGGVLFLALLLLQSIHVSAVPARFGDFDEDGFHTILDLVRLIGHIRGATPLPAALQPYADINQDGVINETDAELLREAVLGNTALPGVPLTRVRETSPASGEVDVSVNRETVLRFTQALSTNTVVGTNNLFATFGGRRILSRGELSTDRRTLTLFYLEPLPASARVRVTLDPSGLKDFLLRGLDPDGDGVEGGKLEVDFDTGAITPVAGTAVIGHVFASDLAPGAKTNEFVNRPLANVTVTVDGAEQTLRTTTDANGFFRLSPSPSGRFFVHVDGRTATGSQWPNGAYYPFVGKAWEAQAGVTNNLAGGNGLIYLPLIPAATLQAVSATTDTVVTFASTVLSNNPSLAGVSITVPANSLFSENGARGGKVGMAPVPPDRLPEPLPPGLRLPLVITVQTDGPQNLDRPAPVRFPNLPDPVTGVKLPPGAKTALWSFNHDTGRWEIAGPMTISADGNFADSDPGVGIRQPGWHGIAPGDQGDPPDPPKPDPDKKCNGPTPKPGWDPSQHSNGCGPEGYDYLVPDLIFTSACNAHDVGYSTCNRPKDVTDNQFLADMLNLCSYIPSPIDQINCKAAAYAYYQAVHQGGNGAYQSAQAEACDCYTPPPPTLAGIELAGLSDPAPRVVSGKVYFAVINDLTHQPVRRGTFIGNPGAMGPTILAPNTPYRLAMVEAETLWEGSAAFVTPPSGQRFKLPTVLLRDPRSWDYDGDGVHDLSEFVIGTDAKNRDSDGDGVPDGAEVQQGLDPLSGQAVVTGVIAAAATSGQAIDVCAENDLAIVADGTAGIVVFNVANRANPVRIASVDTPGNAKAVACSGNVVAVADDTAGLAIVDISDPPAAFIRYRVDLGSASRCVAVAGNLAYVGLASGDVCVVDLSTGTELDRLRLNGNLQDISVSGNTLYVLAVGTLYAIAIDESTLTVAGSVPSPGSQGAGGFRLRLFTGGGLGYAAFTSGYNIFDLSAPRAPVLRRSVATGQFGWQQLVANGSGLGLAVVGPNSTPDGPHDVSLYDLNPGGTNTTFLTTFPTPGLASAVAIYNGIAYVADRTGGLEVVQYMADDRGTNAPSLAVQASFQLTGPTTGLSEEGKRASVTATAGDDIQVRNVEFYLDGARALTDGSFPFEFSFTTPTLSSNRTSFTVQARATDTAGNTTWSPTITVQLVPDATPPVAKKVVPSSSGVTTNANGVFVYFSEPVDPATLLAGAFRVIYAGADNKLGTPDDVTLSNSTLTYRDQQNAIALEFPAPLPPGLYRVILDPSVRDLAGNLIAKGLDYTFWILREGADGDDDNDGLINSREIAAGTNPFDPDSDDDGWDDNVEVSDRTDPLNPASHPSMLFLGKPGPTVLLLPVEDVPSATAGPILGRPGVSIELVATDIALGSLPGPVVGRPQLSVLLTPQEDSPTATGGVIVGRPRVEILLPAPEDLPNPAASPILARPPLSLLLTAPEDIAVPGPYLARPPTRITLSNP